MKKLHRLVCKVICFQLFVIISYSGYAQAPAWSKGLQILPINKEEGLKRVQRALLAEGYTIRGSGSDYFAGQKDIHTAVITCNPTADNKIFVIIFVASSVTDGNIPGGERVRLEDQMTRPSTSVVTTFAPVPASSNGWLLLGTSFRGNIGDKFTINVPPGGAPSGSVWGTDVYTEDSAIGAAAVHAGMITAQNGGTVTIEIRPGLPAYQGSTRNGMASAPYGSWAKSFVFLGARPRASSLPGPVRVPVLSSSNGWPVSGASFWGNIGDRFTINVPPGGAPSGSVWGTDVYTEDSAIGAAAVHAGMITAQNGGTVTIEIRPGLPAYQGSTRNGMASAPYGSWAKSFVFLGGHSPAISPPTGALNGRDFVATLHRGKNGQRFTLYFPPGGNPTGSVWGTDVYTDDSSISAAAVHAGLITAQNGGTVTIEIRPGTPAYHGTARNGVTSSGFDSWFGSFVFIR